MQCSTLIDMLAHDKFPDEWDNKTACAGSFFTQVKMIIRKIIRIIRKIIRIIRKMIIRKTIIRNEHSLYGAESLVIYF